MNTIKIYINLLDEGTPTIRPTEALSLNNGTYKLLATPDYDPEDEHWEFLPGSTVSAEFRETDKGEHILLAVKQVA